jgi:hypothetical protein
MENNVTLALVGSGADYFDLDPTFQNLPDPDPGSQECFTNFYQYM